MKKGSKVLLQARIDSPHSPHSKKPWHRTSRHAIAAYLGTGGDSNPAYAAANTGSSVSSATVDATPGTSGLPPPCITLSDSDRNNSPPAGGSAGFGDAHNEFGIHSDGLEADRQADGEDGGFGAEVGQDDDFQMSDDGGSGLRTTLHGDTMGRLIEEGRPPHEDGYDSAMELEVFHQDCNTADLPAGGFTPQLNAF